MSEIPGLDSPCGRTFRYRDLIECGETWNGAASGPAPIDNLPRRTETFAALDALCRAILDPLAAEWGMPLLTYGFASPRLTARIEGRIAPRLDQHAACELNRAGGPICGRLGAAVDLIVPGRSSRDVARWIVGRTPFDRVYYYGEDRPIHVSAGPARSGVVVRMDRSRSGRLIPRVIGRAAL